MNENTLHSTQQSNQRIKDLLQRIFFLRKHFKALLPEHLQTFRSRVIADHIDAKTSDLFFLLGLMIAHKEEPVTMGEISRAMDVPVSTATRMVDWFVRNHYALRLPDPDDRRVVRVALTDTGLEVYQAIDTFMVERLEKVLVNFTTPEREQLATLLEKFLSFVENES